MLAAREAGDKRDSERDAEHADAPGEKIFE